MKEPTKHLTVAFPVDVYESIRELAKEHEISMTKAINSILRGYLKAKKEREKNGN